MSTIKGFFSKEVAEQERQNVLNHIKNKTAYGVNFKDAVVMPSASINSFCGELQRWEVKLIKS